MRVLFLVPNPIEAASTRYRVVQFFPYLEHSGITCHLAPFISPAFFQMLYTKGSLIPKAFQLLSFALKRLADMIKAGQYNLIFIHREVFLFGPPFGEWFITKGLKKPVVFDFDDALFVPYIS
ncbi:MAG: glycosyltransferase family 1 protein, partial [Candidatus Tectomicrobia bacterium]|nr:glycosyltransferase family 1 protein [Candidatus Tectomicrobia bacterium]